jgi:hypothetical protein
MNLEMGGETTAPSAGIEVYFHRQVARSPAAKRECAGSTATIVTERSESTDKDRFFGARALTEPRALYSFESRGQIMGERSAL